MTSRVEHDGVDFASTAFVVARRLSTVRNADVIVVLEQGRLVERGTHRELMHRRGLYHHLVSTQLEE